MKKLIKYTIFGLLVDAGIYLLASFAFWDLDPSNWDSDGRLLVAFLLAIGIVTTSPILMELEEYNKED